MPAWLWLLAAALVTIPLGAAALYVGACWWQDRHARNEAPPPAAPDDWRDCPAIWP